MKKRILLVNDFYSEGGAESVCRQIEEIFGNSGGLISFFYGSKKYRLPDSVKEYIHSVNFYNEFRDKISSFKPDIIHLHNYYHLLSPSILRAIKNCRKSGDFNGKVIMTAHDYHLLCPDSGLYFNSGDQIVPQKNSTSWWDILTKRYDSRSWSFSVLKKMQWVFNYSMLKLHDQIDTFLAPSKFLQEKYLEKFPDKEIQLVRNPYEIKLGLVNSTVRNMQKGEKVLKMAFLGRVSAEKGIKEFIQALSKSDFKNYQFDIIGDGPDVKKTKELIQHLNLLEKIKLLGRIPYEEVIQKLTNYDVLVLPSLWFENAPLVLVEAVIAQIRILTSNWGGMKELAELCEGSYLMDPLDKDSVQVSVKKIYRDIYEENTPISRDIGKISKEFSQDLFIKKMSNIYSGKIA